MMAIDWVNWGIDSRKVLGGGGNYRGTLGEERRGTLGVRGVFKWFQFSGTTLRDG